MIVGLATDLLTRSWTVQAVQNCTLLKSIHVALYAESFHILRIPKQLSCHAIVSPFARFRPKRWGAIPKSR